MPGPLLPLAARLALLKGAKHIAGRKTAKRQAERMKRQAAEDKKAWLSEKRKEKKKKKENPAKRKYKQKSGADRFDDSTRY